MVHVFPCSGTFYIVPERPGATRYKMRAHVFPDVLERSRMWVCRYKIRVHVFPSVPNVSQHCRRQRRAASPVPLSAFLRVPVHTPYLVVKGIYATVSPCPNVPTTLCP